MLKLTRALLRKLLAPDAHRLQVLDLNVTVMHDSKAGHAQVALVFQVRHPEMPEPHYLLLIAEPTPQLQLFSQELHLHAVRAAQGNAGASDV